MNLIDTIIYETMLETLNAIQRMVIPANETETVTFPDLVKRVKKMHDELILTREALTAAKNYIHFHPANDGGLGEVETYQAYEDALAHLEKLTP